MAQRINKDNFEEKVLKSPLPVLVDFYSDSCIPCKQLSPVLGDIEDEREDTLSVYKVNVNYDMSLQKSMMSWVYRHCGCLCRAKSKQREPVQQEKQISKPGLTKH